MGCPSHGHKWVDCQNRFAKTVAYRLGPRFIRLTRSPIIETKPKKKSPGEKVPKIDLQQTLESSFGLSQFRPGQREILDAILSGRDVMAVLPTGGGKSLCYQLPAMAQKSLVIVISPLIALMKDQVQALDRIGIPAGYLASGQTETERRDVFARLNRSESFLLYLSPERAQKEGFQTWIKNRKIAMFAIDEAHCVSQWGHDFREEYGQLNILKSLRPDIPILALTASATPEVLFDISKQLKLKNPEKMVYGFYRPNLYYQVQHCSDDGEKVAMLREAIRKFPTGRILIYCGTRKVTQEIAGLLSNYFGQVAFYHAGMSTEDRTQTQDDYIQGRTRILAATNAFGMGIDQPDVRLVVHFQMPGNIDALYQEMGRAGRDNKDSTCLLMYSKKDKGLQSFFIQNSDAPAPIKNARYRNLDTLIDYCEGGECRQAEILTYYKDTQRIDRCGHCDVCDPTSDRRVLAPLNVTVADEAFKRTALTKGKAKPKKKTFDVELDPTQQIRFEDLRRWRKEKSLQLDVPAFVILSDRTLRDIVLKNPTSLLDLKDIHGIGDAKLEQFGTEILQQLDL